MSLKIRKLANGKTLTREKQLALLTDPVYDDGLTKQSFCNDCDINMIMDRAAQGGTISHLAKYEGVYADFSDFDFFEHTQKMSQGDEIFDALPAELKREFGQSPAKFFAYVNDPLNKDDLLKKLPGLAMPGTQLPPMSAPNADLDAAQAAADAVPASTPTPTNEVAVSTPPPPAEGSAPSA